LLDIPEGRATAFSLRKTRIDVDALDYTYRENTLGLKGHSRQSLSLFRNKHCISPSDKGDEQAPHAKNLAGRDRRLARFDETAMT